MLQDQLEMVYIVLAEHLYNTNNSAGTGALIVAPWPMDCGLSVYGLCGAKYFRSTANMVRRTSSLLIMPFAFLK